MFQPGFDDQFQKLIHEQAYATMQTASEMGEMCAALGRFRAGLIQQGFSVEGAESMAQELFVMIGDHFGAAREDGDGE